LTFATAGGKEGTLFLVEATRKKNTLFFISSQSQQSTLCTERVGHEQRESEGDRERRKNKNSESKVKEEEDTVLFKSNRQGTGAEEGIQNSSKEVPIG